MACGVNVVGAHHKALGEDVPHCLGHRPPMSTRMEKDLETKSCKEHLKGLKT